MVDVGHLVLILALVCAGYSIFISLVGVRNQRIDQIRSGENAALAVTALLTLSVLLLWQQILAHDFHNEYVANYSNRAMPTFYVLSF